MNSADVKMIHLRAMVASVRTCYETLMQTLDSTVDIVLAWLDENRENVSKALNFPHFFAMTMMAKGSKDWFQPDDKGDNNKSFQNT